MSTLTIHGQENIAAPAFYMPNRLSVQACKALHYLLRGYPVYITDSAFPPLPAVKEYLTTKGIKLVTYDFRHGSPGAVRDLIRSYLHGGRSVIFMPGQLAKVRGCLADVPQLFLEYAQAMRLPVLPIFLGYYGTTLDTLYCDEATPDSREIFHVLPRIPAAPDAAERIYSAWLEKSEEIFSSQPLLSGSLTEHLVHALRRYGSAEMIDGMTGQKFAYSKMLGVAMTLATRLRRLHEKRIGIILPPGPGGTLALLACLFAGVTPVIINYAGSRPAFESTVEQAELKVFISAAPFVAKLPNFAWPPDEQLLLIDKLLKKLPKIRLIVHLLLAHFAPSSLLCRLVHATEHSGDAEAAMLFTAGSTGTPKGVLLTHRMLLTNIAQCCCRLRMDEERVLGSLPLFHSFGFTVALMLPLLKGRPICTYPNPTDARSLCRIIEQYRLTMICATPTFARAMLRRSEPYTFATVRYFIVGAERLSPDSARAFLTRAGVELLEGYGLTEASPVCAVNLPDEPHVAGSAFVIPCRKPRSIGYLLPGIALRITDVDNNDRVLPFTRRGMIWLKGSNFFRGYAKRPELNAEVFHDGWFKTGDIGYMDLHGFITLEGRLSRFSKIGGEMVPHEAVEEAITHILKPPPDLLAYAVTGVLDDRKGEALALLSAMPEHSQPAARRELLSLLRTEFTTHGLPSLWIPRYVVPVAAIPVLAGGKQDLQRCRRLAAEYLLRTPIA